mgnify:CR=1 FL=1
MRDRTLEWSNPAIQEPRVRDLQPLPWEMPQASPDVVQGHLMSAFSAAYPVQHDYFAQPTRARGPTWVNRQLMGFYAGQPYMTPGVRPGVGGGWRAYVSGFPERAPSCDELARLCSKAPRAPVCEWQVLVCGHHGR